MKTRRRQELRSKDGVDFQFITAGYYFNLVSQVAVECAVNPPKKGEASYELYMKERTSILKSLEMKARMVENAFNALPGISCSAIQGAMYAFPQVQTS